MSANATSGFVTCIFCEERFSAKRNRCPSCLQWRIATQQKIEQRLLRLSEVKEEANEKRISTGPWDSAFGAWVDTRGANLESGIVLTSVTLIGGSPGAGKSTISLQITDAVALITGRDVVYIGTEQSGGEIKQSALRLRLSRFNNILLVPMGADFTMAMIEAAKPAAIIVDSLSGMTKDHDMQVTVCRTFKEFAVKNRCPVIIIDHVTKDQDFAGLMAMQHEVDTLLTLYPIEVPRGMCEWCEDETCIGCEREMVVEKNRFGKAQVSIRMIMSPTGIIAKPLRA